MYNNVSLSHTRVPPSPAPRSLQGSRSDDILWVVDGVRITNRPVWNLTGKHNFTDEWYVQGNVGTSFRSPDAEKLFLDEVYYPNNDGVPENGFWVGNPDLEPEEGENINVSLGGALNARITLELTYFTRDVRNYVSSVPTTMAGVEGYTYANTDNEANIDGFELIARAELSDSLVGQLSFTRTDARDNNEGPQLMNIPKREAKLGLYYRPVNATYGFSLNNNYVSEVNDRGGQVRDSYFLTDVSAFYHFGADKQHELVLRLENLTDEEYATGVGSARADVSGESYFYENLGMDRSLHFSYTYKF